MKAPVVIQECLRLPLGFKRAHRARDSPERSPRAYPLGDMVLVVVVVMEWLQVIDQQGSSIFYLKLPRRVP